MRRSVHSLVSPFEAVTHCGNGIGRTRSRPDSQPHHPPPLRYLPVPLEAELLEQVGRAGMEIGTALRGAPLDLLGVGLDEPTSSIVMAASAAPRAARATPLRRCPL